MSEWTNPQTEDFNTIKDGAKVAQVTTDVVFDNIRGNLTYLYDHLNVLAQDKSSLVLYAEEVSKDELEGLDAFDYKSGMPVFLHEGKWKPAGLALDHTTSTSARWGYDSPSFSCGVVIRQYTSQGNDVVDVILAGDYSFEVVGSSLNLLKGPDGSLVPLSDVYEEDCFVGGVFELPSMKSGVYYLSETSGKLSTNSVYTIALGVFFIIEGDTNHIRMFVQPEGFAGHRQHQHESVDLTDGTAKTFTYANIPGAWSTTVGLLASDASKGTGEATEYPYSELTDTATPADLYIDGGSGVDDILPSGGWLDINDSYFTETIPNGGLGLAVGEIPATALWGYTVNHLERFNYSWANINGIYDLGSMVLAINGEPVNKNHYLIDEFGIWWLQDGYEHAPFQNQLEHIRNVELFYVNPVLATEAIAIGSITSNTLLGKKEGTTTTLDTLDGYLSVPMSPVLPFNPTVDIRRATVEEAQLGTEDNSLMTPATTGELLGALYNLTQGSAARSAKIFSGTDLNDLQEGGFWSVGNITNSPGGSAGGYLGFSIVTPGSIVHLFVNAVSSLAYFRTYTTLGEWSSWVGIGTTATPTGAIVMWPDNLPERFPEGWALCNGALVSSQGEYSNLYKVIGNTYGGDQTKSEFRLPDYRGLFVRGWNGGRTGDWADQDSGRKDRGDGGDGILVGTKQAEDFKSHTHDVMDGAGGDQTNSITAGGGSFSGSNYSEEWVSSDEYTLIHSTGGTETRPNNISAMYIIKL